jgi:hypothetical protein
MFSHPNPHVFAPKSDIFVSNFAQKYPFFYQKKTHFFVSKTPILPLFLIKNTHFLSNSPKTPKSPQKYPNTQKHSFSYQNPSKTPIFLSKNTHFTIKNTHFPTKNTHFPIKNTHFPIKFRIKNAPETDKSRFSGGLQSN